MPSTPSADRNLLFGILALQMDFITRDQLIEAMNAWAVEKAKPLGEILVAHGAMKPGDLALLKPLVDRHVEQHGGDPKKSLASISSIGSAREQLERVADADIRASLSIVASARTDDPGLTIAAPTVGESTSTGLRFKILRPHDKGGLGQVSVALDQELNREVALKEIQDKHADKPESRARFLLEAEVTGGLEHPGIVPVYGLGTYADGRPFYAMRFIRGDNLQKAIQRFHGSGARFDSIEFRELLGRFVDVCNAVAYAHSRKVLHRDLKPGNVMLGKYGETLVVDWGLAKSNERDDQTSTLQSEEPPLRPTSTSGSAETLPGSAVGTPEYMSPEQAGGRWDIMGPATDVYSLGATLFELLTGRPSIPKGELGEMLRRVEKGEIVPPRQVNPHVPSALEAVCRKAMALTPEDRYDSVLEVAKEVERWLADEPVIAYAESLAARSRRWVRHHARVVTGAAAALTVAAAALGLVGWQRERARLALAHEQAQTVRERDAKEVERQKAVAEKERALTARKQTRDALDAMVSGVAGDSLTTQTTITPEQRKFLDAVLKYYEAFAAETEQDREGRERLANAHLSLAVIQQRLGQADTSSATFQRTVDLWQQLSADFPAVTLYRQQLAKSHNALGLVLHGLRQSARSESSYRASLEVWRKLVGDFPAEPSFRSSLALSYNNLGWLLDGLSQSSEAASYFQKSLALQERLAAEFPGDPVYRREVARTNNNLGILLRDLGQFKDAEKAHRAALTIQERLVDEFPADATYQQELGRTRSNLGLLLAGLGHFAEAEVSYRDALKVREQLATSYPAAPAYRLELSRTQNSLGSSLERQSKYADAEAAYRAALVVQDKLVVDLPTQPEYRAYMALTRTNLGDLLVKLDKRVEAEVAYRAALAVREKLVTDFPNVPDYASKLGAGHNQFGLLLANTGKNAEAEEHYRAAVAIHERLANAFPGVPGHRQELAIAHGNLGISQAGQGNVKNAEASQRSAMALWDKLAADAPTVVAFNNGLVRCRSRLAELLARSGDYREAAAHAEFVAESKFAAAAELYTAARVFAISGRASSAERGGDLGRAVVVLRRAIDKGYRDIPHLLGDTDLDHLRRRDEFADLLWDLANGPNTRQP